MASAVRASVVAGHERIHCHQHRGPRLVEHIFQFGGPVRGVDRDQDRADAGRRVLHQHPLRVVGAPDPDSVALGHAGGHQPAGHPIDLSSELGVAVAQTLLDRHQRIAVAVLGDGAGQVLGDRLLQQRHRGRSGVRGRDHGVLLQRVTSVLRGYAGAA